MSLSDVAFAAGFSSIRQFNETVREVYALTPTAAARDGGPRVGRPAEPSSMRLAVRTPFAGAACSTSSPTTSCRAWRWPDRAGTPAPSTCRTAPARSGSSSPTTVAAGETAFVTAKFSLQDLRDTSAAVERVRRLLDADCDPVAVDDHLADDPVIGRLVRAHPGLRVPGQVDGDETAVRTVIGQQVSVTGARTVTGRLVAEHGRRVESDVPGLTHLFPDAADPGAGRPGDRCRCPARAAGRWSACAAALAAGDVALDRGPDRDDVRRALLELPGIGPWTADYVAMRALGHPDVFLPTDLGRAQRAARPRHPGRRRRPTASTGDRGAPTP